MSNVIRTYYDYVLAQMAADSYLDALQDSTFDFKNPILLSERLEFGANHYSVIEQLRAEGPLSATQMTPVMVNDFLATWEVIDHLPNTSSGFSATVLKNKLTGEYALSFRSTESKDAEDGGDVERDSSAGANGQIAELGFAWGQLRDMENYYQDLISGNLNVGSTEDAQALTDYLTDPAKKITLTGYSLGSHLAQLFTFMHDEKVEHVYTFNGAGFGQLDGLPSLAGEINGLIAADEYGQAILSRISLIEQIENDPASFIDNVTASEFSDIGYPLGAEFNAKEAAVNRLLSDRQEFLSANILTEYPNIYNDPLFKYVIQSLPEDSTGAQTVSILEILPDFSGATRDQITPFNKITNLFGHAIPAEDRPLGEVVAGAGQIFGEFLPVIIEDQPVVDTDFFNNAFNILLGPNNGDAFLRSFGPTHSIALLADSLAVMDLFAMLDPQLTLPVINAMFSASSNYSASNVPGFRHSEGDTLERVMDSLGKLLLGDQWVATVSNDQPGSFGDLDLRTTFYANVDEIRNYIFTEQRTLKPEFNDLGLEVINLQTFDKTGMVEGAKDSIAWRYALRELNPFVIEGISASAEEQLYGIHNQQNELDLFDPDTKEGLLTEDYLKDRAAFLAATIEANLQNDTGINIELGDEYTNTKFIDANDGDTDPTTAITVTNNTALGSVERFVIFGLQGDDVNTPQTGAVILQGSDGNDAIYGQGGDDKLSGGKGRDFLEGGAGADTLYGGGLSGPALEHEDDGIKDTLKGGPGDDRYYVGHLDVIEDSDPINQTELIDFNGTDARGTYEELIPGSVYKHETNGLLLTLSGRDANIKQVTDDGTTFFTIKNFLDENGQRNDGEYGISLDIPTPLEPTQVYTNPAGTTDFTIRETNLVDGGTVISGPYEKAVGNDDAVFLGATGSLGNLIYHEIIDVERSPGFVVEGGAGYDWIRIDYNVSPFVSGQTYEPTAGGPGGFSTGVEVHGQGGDDIIYGGLDNDRLFGGEGDDLIATWDGNDVHHGDARDDTLGSNDYFYGKNQTQGTNYDVTADDFYSGGTGKDFITDDWGNDTAFGDEGSDFIATGSGADTVFGGDGDDVIYSDRRFSGFHGERSWTLFYDGKGRPVNVNLFSMTFQGEALQAGGDYIDGGAGSDLILSGAGDDTVLGGSGNDAINTQAGDDYVDGGDDDDLIFGEDGFDVLAGGKGEDSIHGGADDDFIEGGADDDRLWGDAGMDVLHGDGGDDTLYGGTENDTLNGGADNDTLYGEAGEDTLLGGSGVDTLHGGDDDDFLDGGAGADTIYGGLGNDTIVIDKDDTVDGGANDDHYTLLSGARDVNIIDSEGNDTLEFTEDITAADLIINRVNGNVTITTPESQVTINDWANNTFERLLFSDASELTNTDIEAAINDKPVLDGTLADQVINEDAFFEYVIPDTAFSDPDGDALSYSATLANDDPLPEWLKFDPLTKTFSGIPKNTDVASIDVKVIVTDAGGLNESTAFSLQVNNTNDAPVAVADVINHVFTSDPILYEDTQLVLEYPNEYSNNTYDFHAVEFSFIENNQALLNARSLASGITTYFGNQIVSNNGMVNAENTVSFTEGLAANKTLDNGLSFYFSGHPADDAYFPGLFTAKAYDLNTRSLVLPEFEINTNVEWEVSSVDVAGLANGDIVVVWSAYNPGTNYPDTLSYQVFSRRFDSNGNALGEVETIHPGANPGEIYKNPGIMSLSNGGYRIFFNHEYENNNVSEILYNTYDNSGQILENNVALALPGDPAARIVDIDIKETLNDTYHAFVRYRASNGTPDDTSDDTTETALLRYDQAGSLLTEQIIPDELRNNIDNRFTELSNGYFAVLTHLAPPNEDSPYSGYLEYQQSGSPPISAYQYYLQYHHSAIGLDILDSSFDTIMDDYIVNEFDYFGLAAGDFDILGIEDGRLLVSWREEKPTFPSDDIFLGRYRVNDGNVSLILDVLNNDFDIDPGQNTADLIITDANVRNGFPGVVSIEDGKLVYKLDTQSNPVTALSNVVVDYTISDPDGAQSVSSATILLRDENTPSAGTSNDDDIIVDNANPVIDSGAGNDTVDITATNVPVTVLAGTGDDIISVNGAETVTAFGEAGADTFNIDLTAITNPTSTPITYNLNGGEGADHYIITGSTSYDVTVNINDTDGPNTLTFGPDYDPANLRLSLGSLKLGFDDNPAEIHLVNLDPNDVFGGPRDINVFEFAGVTLTYDELLAQGLDINGTTGDDILFGTNTVDRITGLAGNDAITSGDGDDVITGGAGNDDLRGGRGNDTYIFNRGDGRDVITDNQGNDQITFGPGIGSSDLRVTQQGDALVIGLLDNGQPTDDQITLSGWFTDSARQLEKVRLSSGETVSAAELETLIPTENAYRYYRFTPTKLRNEVAANSVQISELQLFYQGQAVTGAAVSNPGGSNPVNEEPFRAVDGDTSTKWLDFHKGPLVLDYGNSVVIDGFSWSTANDYPARDPVQWLLEGSNDSQDWTVLDDQTGADFAVPTARFTAIPVQAFVNIAPVAEDDTGTVMTGSSVNINVINNDTDPDDGLDPAGIRIETTPVNGTVTVNEDGTVTYDHDGSSTGADSFTYTIADVSGDASNPATVDLTVLDQDGTAYRYYRLTPTKLRNDATANSVQVSELQLFYQGQALTGATVSNPGGSNPQNEEPFRAVDGDLTSKWLDFNKGPLVLDFGTELVADSYRFATANDHAERDPVRWRLEASQDQLEWNVLDDQSGADFPTPLSRFTFLEKKTFTNEAPIAADDTATVMAGSSVNINVINNDTDPDDGLDPASINIQSGPEHGSLFSNNNGAVIYTHDGSEASHDSFTYTIADPSGAESEPATVDLSILDQTGSGYRYYRLTPTKLRNDATANSVQVSELQLFYQGQALTGATVSNPGGSNPQNEEPFRAVDGDLTSKWLDFNKGSLVLDFGTELVADSYRFATANDHAERDPVRWQLEASNNNTDWVMLDDQTLISADVPTARFSFISEQMTADVQTGVDQQSDQFIADAGSDTLLGLTGDDHYRVHAGSGIDHIQDQGGDDTLEFTGLQHDDLWFWQYDQDLRVGTVGSQDYVSIQDWYADETNHIETMTAADGSATLIDTQVQQLVEAMAVFDVQAAGNLNVPQQHQDDVQSVIAAAWTTT